MARQISAEEEVDDMVECSICTEVFSDPRVLPCIHTFCFKCLMNYGKDKQPGDAMPCPLCRKEFTIPDDGLQTMQKNFFMEKLLRTRMVSVAKEAQGIPCDACSSDEASVHITAKPASMYCVKCHQNYCDHCSRSHTRMKATADHVQVEIGKREHLQHDEPVLRLSAATCDIHKDEEIKVFCLDCRVAICVTCLLKSHKTHNCLNIAQVSSDLRKRVKTDADKITEYLEKIGEIPSCLEKEQDGLINHITRTEGEINIAADNMIAAVERDRAKLLSEVESIKVKRVKQLEMAKQEVEQHMTALASVIRDSEALLSSGTDCDVTRSADSLHNRTDQLMKLNIMSRTRCSSPPPAYFVPSAFQDRDAANIVGTVSELEPVSPTSLPSVCAEFTPSTAFHDATENSTGTRSERGRITPFVCDEFTPSTPLHNVSQNLSGSDSEGDTTSIEPTVTHVIPDDGVGVGGVAALGNEVFVVRRDSQQIDVYNANTFRRKRYIKVRGLGPISLGLAACGANKCLYASDTDNDVIHRVQLSGKNRVVQWSTARQPTGVTVNRANNLVVLSNMLQVFTTDGDLLEDIQLQTDIEKPVGVIEVCSDQYAVSYEGSMHRVCLVDVDSIDWKGRATVLGRYGTKKGSGLTKLCRPAGLAVDKHGNILVAEEDNDRLLVLDNSLTTAHKMSVSGGLDGPFSVWYDQPRARLYIGEYIGGRVFVIDNLEDFTADKVYF